MEDVGEDQEEELEVENVRNVSIHAVPLSTLREFQQFARTHAFNKYAIALRLLLDRSAVLEMFSQLELRIRALENHVYKEQLIGDDSKRPRTFGGKKDE